MASLFHARARKSGEMRSDSPSVAAMLLARAMYEYNNPYREDPELAPLTRVGRVLECAAAVMLALLAIILSR
jgi:hypothetical protein